MTTNNITPIMILGMHRSGTSCLAGSLQSAGLCLGSVSISNTYNPKGNRENSLIMLLNDELLNYNNSNWCSPPPTKLNWEEKHTNQAKKITTSLKKNCDSQYFGFKDPRTLLTFDFWDNTLPNAKLVGTIRNPIDVASSLNSRDKNFSIENGLKLWLYYNSKLLKLLKRNSFPLISFDYSKELYSDKINEIIPVLLPKHTSNTCDFFTDSLRNPNIKTIKLTQDIINCYTELKTFLT